MATESLPEVADATTSPPVPAVLFAFRAEKDARVVAEVFCFDHVSEVRVMAEITPIRAPLDSDPLRHFCTFRNVKEARHFIDEALITFEYLGCTVREIGLADEPA